MVGIKINDWGPSDVRREEELFWKEMAPFVASTVEATFRTEDMKHPTYAEVKDRTEKAKRLVDAMRKDFKWSKHRIRDNLLTALRAELGGVAVDLATLGKRSTW